MLSSRRSATHTSRESVTQDNGRSEGSHLKKRAAVRPATVIRRAAARGVMSKQRASRSSDQEVMRHLSRSQIFKDYELAFSEAMGLPLNIRGRDSWSPAHHGKEDQDSFASILARFNKARAACLRAQTDASRESDSTTRTVTWFAGLSESAVPVYIGDHILGFLETGEVMLKNPTKKHFASITQQLRAWGYKADWKQLERAYFRTCVLPPDRYRAMLRLLSIFAQHLSILSNQLAVRREKDEPANMARARQFIEKHQAEPLSLGRVARAANISRYYFCKMFKKATGINFIDYLSRVRVEKSKTLLLNPNSRISEAAFACGFQSMTNFNREFKRIVGRSPTQFRESLPKLRRSVQTANSTG
jgi:AraC-like DNA-binding protein/ligand-binding sensor protein